MSGSKAGSHVDETHNTETVKRKIIPTVKALVSKMEKLQKERQAKVNKIKGVIIALKELMENNDNVSKVESQLDILMQMNEEAISLHGSLMDIIPEEEKDKQNEWFGSINKYNKGFIEDVTQWISETKRPISGHARTDTVEILQNDKECENRSSLPLTESEVDKMSSNVGQDDLPEKLKNLVQDDIQPNDSISNVGSRKHGSDTRTTRSSTSSVSSSRVKAEAEMAALLARQKLLKQKQELDL